MEGVNVEEKSYVDIHTSDKVAFKKCRRKFLFSNRRHLNLQPKTSNPNLGFGTAIHAGLESYYSGEDQERVIKDFVASLYSFNLDDAKLYELEQLGIGMLKNFADYASADTSEVIAVEYDFSVPIKVSDREYFERNAHIDFSIHKDGTLLFDNKRVHYDGTVDLLIKNPKGEYWIIDHKTAGKIYDDKFSLNTNEQITAYIWALRQLGYDIKGFIYQELLKKAPETIRPLKRLYKGRRFSTSMSNTVILDHYILTLLDAGEDIELYSDYIQFLKQNPNPFFKRTHVTRTESELKMFEHILTYEVIDMLSPETVMYPTPDYFGCNFCDFQDPCIAMNQTEDWQYILENAYIPRKR